MPLVEPGKKAPDFQLKDQDGKTHTLADYAGRPVVLYFYPKDDTPGCTKQACGIRDAYDSFREAGAVVLGVSPDDEGSHTKFKSKFQLPFTLLADTDHDAAEQYDVWKERSMYGKTFMGIERSTFVIDREGNVAREFRKVNPEAHAGLVLEALAAL
jgi:thioredoxin-dependent peroxiredoxin